MRLFNAVAVSSLSRAPGNRLGILTQVRHGIADGLDSDRAYLFALG
jgi:hypothetical protein